MPAGLLPPRREKLFSDTSARYLETVHREKKEYVPPPMPTYATQANWAQTSSRYADPRPDKAAAAKPAIDTNDPLSGWAAAADHRNMARRVIGNPTSRYAEDAEVKGHPAVTPRQLADKKGEQGKLEKNWRGTHALNAHTTFDVMYAKWLKKNEGAKFMQRKKNSARSPVADWVRNDTPIEPTRRGAGNSPGRAATPTPARAGSSPAAGRGGAGAGAVRRSQSPWERTWVDPETFIGGRWKGAGVSLTDFDKLKKQTCKAQPQMAAMEQHAIEVVNHTNDKRVDKSFVPRVYKLSLAAQIPESARQSLSRKDTGSFGPMYSIGGGGGERGGGSRSPSRSPSGRAARKASPTRR